MIIAGLQKVSLIDFPGRVAATVFLAGCNLDCGYCHNRWMLAPESVTPAMTVADLLAWLETRVGLLDGICVSGGEPLIWPEVGELLAAIRQLGLATKVDTNGTRPAALRALLAAGLVDYVAMDFKAPLDGRYAQTAGRAVDLGALNESLTLLAGAGIPFELRTTVHPRIDAAALEAMATTIAERMPPEMPWYVQRFVAAPGVDPALAALPAMDDDALAALTEQLRAMAPNIRLRGGD